MVRSTYLPPRYLESGITAATSAGLVGTSLSLSLSSPRAWIASGDRAPAARFGPGEPARNTPSPGNELFFSFFSSLAPVGRARLGLGAGATFLGHRLKGCSLH